MAPEPTFEPARRSSHAERHRRMRRRYVFLGAGLLVGLVVGIVLGALLGASRGGKQPMDSTALTTQYQMVVLTGGQTLVGKLEGLGSAFPVLYDAHTVQKQVNQESKEVTEALLPHEGDSMILNAQHIVYVESVKPGSRLAVLIEAATSKK